MATKWAYLTVTKLPTGWLVEGDAVLSSDEDPAQVLALLGNEGWELVTAFLQPQRYIFKQPQPGAAVGPVDVAPVEPAGVASGINELGRQLNQGLPQVEKSKPEL